MEKWHKKYKTFYKEYSQYVALNQNFGKMYAKFEKDLTILETKAGEMDEEKFPCKDKVADIKGVWDSIKALDTEVETARGETQDARFKVETLTHELKH